MRSAPRSGLCTDTHSGAPIAGSSLCRCPCVHPTKAWQRFGRLVQSLGMGADDQAEVVGADMMHCPKATVWTTRTTARAARGGAWRRVAARGGAWRRVAARGSANCVHASHPATYSPARALRASQRRPGECGTASSAFPVEEVNQSIDLGDGQPGALQPPTSLVPHRLPRLRCGVATFEPPDQVGQPLSDQELADCCSVSLADGPQPERRALACLLAVRPTVGGMPVDRQRRVRRLLLPCCSHHSHILSSGTEGGLNLGRLQWPGEVRGEAMGHTLSVSVGLTAPAGISGRA